LLYAQIFSYIARRGGLYGSSSRDDFPAGYGVTKAGIGTAMDSCRSGRLPLILDMLPEKIEPHYGSDRIFNCDLKPVNHTRSIEGETVLEIKGGYGMEAQGMEKAEQ